jgi:hypothetical protein
MTTDTSTAFTAERSVEAKVQRLHTVNHHGQGDRLGYGSCLRS